LRFGFLVSSLRRLLLSLLRDGDGVEERNRVPFFAVLWRRLERKPEFCGSNERRLLSPLSDFFLK
jgi:hypothetical protein